MNALSVATVPVLETADVVTQARRQVAGGREVSVTLPPARFAGARPALAAAG